LRRRDGTILWQQQGLRRRSTGTPAVVGSAVVVGDFDGYLHWLDRSDGRFVARQRPGRDRIAAAPLVVGNRVYVIDEGGQIAAFQSGDAAGR
jgi:outer membrane protein assembly factor BamB